MKFPRPAPRSSRGDGGKALTIAISYTLEWAAKTSTRNLYYKYSTGTSERILCKILILCSQIKVKKSMEALCLKAKEKGAPRFRLNMRYI